MTKKTSSINLTITDVVKHLKGLLKHTNQEARVNKVKGHIREVEAAKKAKADLASTRIGATLNSFAKVNARKTIDAKATFAFLHTRLLQGNPARPNTRYLVEQGLKYRTNKVKSAANDVRRIAHA